MNDFNETSLKNSISIESVIINMMADLCTDFAPYNFLAKSDLYKGSLFGGNNIYYKKGINNTNGMITSKSNIKKYNLNIFPTNFISQNDINGSIEYGWSGEVLVEVLKHLQKNQPLAWDSSNTDNEANSLIDGIQFNNLNILIKNFKKKLPKVELKASELEKLRQSFVNDFNLKRISKLTKEEYVIGLDNKNSFCYRIERELQEYGDMRGATSAKFGLYFGKIGDDTEKKYRSTNKYSNDPDIAIVEIRNHIGGLYLDGLNQQYEAIKENPISPMFKGKILAMYFPENYLCIYSEEHIDHFISCLNIKTSNTDNILDKQLKLLSWKNDHEEINTWSNYVFAVFLYDAFGRPLSIEQDKKALQEERDKEYPREYATKIGVSISQWKTLLKSKDIFTNENIELLKRFYISDNHATTCYDLGVQDGVSPTSYISPIVSLARRISSTLELDPIYSEEGDRVWWRILFWGRQREDGKFEWKLRPKLAKAMAELYPELEVEICDSLESREDEELVNDLKNIIQLNDATIYVATPKKKDVPIYIDGHKTYPRNRQIAINALALANYSCEIDANHPSFIRKNSNKQYTEPHHLIPLSYSDRFDVSLDIEANIVSLCSNCHNHIHYGQDADSLIKKLYYERKNLLKEAGINITLDELLTMYGFNSSENALE